MKRPGLEEQTESSAFQRKTFFSNDCYEKKTYLANFNECKRRPLLGERLIHIGLMNAFVMVKVSKVWRPSNKAVVFGSHAASVLLSFESEAKSESHLQEGEVMDIKCGGGKNNNLKSILHPLASCHMHTHLLFVSFAPVLEEEEDSL